MENKAPRIKHDGTKKPPSILTVRILKDIFNRHIPIDERRMLIAAVEASLIKRHDLLELMINQCCNAKKECKKLPNALLHECKGVPPLDSDDYDAPKGGRRYG